MSRNAPAPRGGPEKQLTFDEAIEIVIQADEELASPGLSPKLDTKTAVWAMCQLLGITGNGGFHYFFERDFVQRMDYSFFVRACRAVGANEAAEILEAVLSEFAFPNPHLDRDARLATLETLRKTHGDTNPIESLNARLFRSRDENYTLLARYILDHPTEFPTACGADEH